MFAKYSLITMHRFLELKSCIRDGQIWLVHGVAYPCENVLYR